MKKLHGAGGIRYLIMNCTDICSMDPYQDHADLFDLLALQARESGAIQVKIISTEEIVVENRVTLKCRTGCLEYGKNLSCPPYVPTVAEFRKILQEYRYAMLVKFRSPAFATEEVACAPYKTWLDPAEPEEVREKAEAFWSQYYEYSREILTAMLGLEKTAFYRGCTFALAFVNGSCRLCETCNAGKGTCVHPHMARIPAHALGVNMKKTAELAEIPFTLPIKGHPEPIALLLID
jgi:predicted metal-binding protein